jgi:hypothetical protein
MRRWKDVRRSSRALGWQIRRLQGYARWQYEGFGCLCPEHPYCCCTQESKERRVKIEKVESVIFDHLLWFIYTGSRPIDFELLANDEVHALLLLADQYQVSDLVTLLCDRIIDTLTIATFPRQYVHLRKRFEAQRLQSRMLLWLSGLKKEHLCEMLQSEANKPYLKDGDILVEWCLFLNGSRAPPSNKWSNFIS